MDANRLLDSARYLGIFAGVVLFSGGVAAVILWVLLMAPTLCVTASAPLLLPHFNPDKRGSKRSSKINCITVVSDLVACAVTAFVAVITFFTEAPRKQPSAPSRDFGSGHRGCLGVRKPS